MLRSYSAVGRDRHSCVLECSDDYPALWVHFGLARFLAAIPTGARGDAGDGGGGAAWVRFCVIILALRRFPRGVRWGEMWKPHCGRAPDCAKESSTLWTLLTLRRDCVGAYSPRRHPGTRKDPPESNLCSGGSGCISMLPIRSNVQTRAARRQRRGVGLRARSGVDAAQPPGCVREAVWMQTQFASLRPMRTPMTEAIIRPRVQPEESPRQCRPRRLVLKSSSILTRLE